MRRHSRIWLAESHAKVRTDRPSASVLVEEPGGIRADGGIDAEMAERGQLSDSDPSHRSSAHVERDHLALEWLNTLKWNEKRIMLKT